MVNVTGNLKLFKITFPVFDETSDVEYHKAHNNTNRMVDVDGIGNDKLANRDCEVVVVVVDEEEGEIGR